MGRISETRLKLRLFNLDNFQFLNNEFLGIVPRASSVSLSGNGLEPWAEVWYQVKSETVDFLKRINFTENHCVM